MKHVDEGTRAFAEERVRWLCEAYDVDASAKDAFIHDMTNEIVSILEAFLNAVDKVSKANAEGLVSEQQNRRMRREAKALLRRRKR